jgi:hypothetical protein
MNKNWFFYLKKSNIFYNLALSVTKITFRNKKSILGVGEKINMDVLDIYFDQKLYMDDGNNLKAFTSYNFTWDILNTSNPPNSIPICMGKTSALCPRLPEGLLNLVGMFRIDCLNNAIINPFSSQGKIITYTEGYGKNNIIIDEFFLYHQKIKLHI